MIDSKKLKKVHGGLVLVEKNGNIQEITYEDALENWLKENTPPAVDTEAICKALDFSYDTIQPKLKNLATKVENTEEKGVRIKKEPRSIGQIGRRKYLWYWG